MSEQKKTIFPFGWILLVCIIMTFLAYYFYIHRYQDERQVNLHKVTTNLISRRENDTTVNAYITFINDGRGKMDLNHAYSNEALVKLAAAVNAMAKAVNYTIKSDMGTAETDANKIIRDPMAVSHADNIRKAADILSEALSNMQHDKYPSLAGEAEKVKEAASKIDPDVLTLDQKNKVKTFFDQAAELLKKMN